MRLSKSGPRRSALNLLIGLYDNEIFKVSKVIPPSTLFLQPSINYRIPATNLTPFPLRAPPVTVMVASAAAFVSHANIRNNNNNSSSSSSSTDSLWKIQLFFLCGLRLAMSVNTQETQIHSVELIQHHWNALQRTMRSLCCCCSCCCRCV